MAVATQTAWRAENVDTTTIEARIGGLWKELVSRSSELAPVRTRLFNLVVYAGEKQVADAVLKRVEALGQRHPSRSIVLLTDRLNPQSSVDAEVTLLPVGPPEAGSTYFEERVLITARGRAADHPASLVMSVLVPDLPTYLWWPGQPPFGHRVFHRLLSTANKVVVDSSQFDSPGDGMSALAGICRSDQSVHDFHWARLQPWREIVAQFFDGETHVPFVRNIRSITFEFGSGKGVGTGSWSTAGVLLLLGWLASRLGWRPETTIDRAFTKDVSMAVLQRERVIPVNINFRDYGERAEAHLMRLEIEAQPPGQQPAKCEILRFEDLRTVQVTAEFPGENKVFRVVPLDIRTDEEILGAQLEVSGHDHLYQGVVEMASYLAGREVLAPA